VRSVLAQTLEAIETIVVIDGPDKTTEHNLGQLDDPRVRMILSPNEAPRRKQRGASLK